MVTVLTKPKYVVALLGDVWAQTLLAPVVFHVQLYNFAFYSTTPEFVENRLREKISGTIMYMKSLLETEPMDTKFTGYFYFILSNHVLQEGLIPKGRNNKKAQELMVQLIAPIHQPYFSYPHSSASR